MFARVSRAASSCLEGKANSQGTSAFGKEAVQGSEEADTWSDLSGRSAKLHATRASGARKKAHEKLSRLEGVVMASGRSVKGMKVKAAPAREEFMNSWSGLFSGKSPSSSGNLSNSEHHLDAMMSEHEADLRKSGFC